jgi:DNA invertase Pin-like site-specific DNA recombinase
VKTSTPSPVAYSYVRFSDPAQAKGDSLRRQTEAAARWCEKNGVALDASLTLHDKGCSAYKGLHRENPDKHALALFLKLVEKGRVRPGDYLVIENLDRLSREEEVPACHLLTGILMAGVRVVQMSPYEMLLTDKSNGWELMRAVMELSRGHGESAIKSARVDKAWQQRLARTRKGEVILTRSLPAWVEVLDGKLCPIPERAAALKRIYYLAAAGYGHVRIVKKLVAEGVAPFGGRESYEDEEGNVRSRAAAGDAYGSGSWTKAYVHKLLNDRRTLGEFQPLKADGSPDGTLLANYFPAVITEAEWDAARAGAIRRFVENRLGERKFNNSSKHVDVFAGLMRDARDGGAIFCTTRTVPGRRAGAGRHSRVLINANGREGRIPTVTFPYPAFEREVLAKLAEIDPAEVIGDDDDPSEAAVLAGELARVESSIAAVAAELENGESPTLFQRLRTLEARQAELTEQLAVVRQRAAHPLSEAWGECQSLASLIDGAADPDDVRLRIRTALRRMAEGVWCLFLARGAWRIAAVQIWFHGGAHRDYFVLYRRAVSGNAPARPAYCDSADMARVAQPGELDLRKRDHAKRLEKVLLAMPLPS